MKQFLTLKHWQLLLLLIIPSIFISESPWKEIAIAINGLVYLIWIYSISHFGQEKIKELSLRPMNERLFSVNLFLLPCLIIVSNFIIPNQNESFDIRDILIAVLGIYSGFAILQVLFFTAKILATVEYKREVYFGDYFLNFILIAVFIFGIWTLQPKINKYFN
jgi:hypothetical protein